MSYCHSFYDFLLLIQPFSVSIVLRERDLVVRLSSYQNVLLQKITKSSCYNNQNHSVKMEMANLCKWKLNCKKTFKNVAFTLSTGFSPTFVRCNCDGIYQPCRFVLVSYPVSRVSKSKTRRQRILACTREESGKKMPPSSPGLPSVFKSIYGRVTFCNLL